MVETESNNVGELDLGEVEVEGNQIGSKSYRFSKIGEPIPILDVDSEFDPQSPPSCPLAVSQRFRLMLVAHPTGFCVARTEDAIKSSASSIRELCVVNVPIGKVSILALSANSSTLAASVGSHLHFFLVTSLLKQEQEPSFSFPLNDSSCIKDLRWSTKLEDHYLLLSSNGKLYHGAVQDDAKDVMSEVDAVDWSAEGNYIAMARNNVLCIMSSKGSEKMRLRLSFKSLSVDSDANCIIKVDSIRWVRPDSIILGCYQLTDGKEENYLVQVISCKHGKITDASSSPVVLSFSNVFPCLSDADVPFGSGPHMCLSYLDTCGLAFTANQKNMDQHIVLLGWAIEDRNEVAVIEIVNDSWAPRIDSKGDGDDNMILGLSLDKVSYDEKVKFICGDEDKEVSPCCIVLCVTIDGKLSMFHFASAASSSVPPEAACSTFGEEENNYPVGSSGYGTLSLSTSNAEQCIDGIHFGVKSGELKVNQLYRKGGDETPINRIEPIKIVESSEIFRGSAQQKGPSEIPSHDRDVRQQPGSVKEGGNKEQTMASLLVDSGDFSRSNIQEHAEVGPDSGSFSGQLSIDISNKTLPGVSPKESMADTGLSEPIVSTTSKGALSGFQSSKALILSKPSGERSSSLLNAGLLGNQPVADLTAANLAVGQLHSSYFNKTAGPSTPADQLGMRASVSYSGMTDIQSARPQPHENITMRKSSDFKSLADKSNQRTNAPAGLPNSEPNLSKQIRSVEEMAKELDVLLERIEGPSGFNDASINLQKMSVASLEKGIWALSDRCRAWMEILDQGIEAIQLLPDKMVQVLARKNCMEGIVKQATDSQYLDLWNRQKLTSELEIKHRHILEVNQNLANQLIELEGHLNTLELKKFGQKDGLELNRRSTQRHGPPRHIQSLHSLHNTMSAQLVAAEQLSEYLSEQMAVLGVESTPLRKQNIRNEVFKAIGISHDDATFSPPDKEKAGSILSRKGLLLSSGSAASISRSTRNQSSLLKNSEPETARRRRDSLGQSWASFEPPKTTVKRILLREDNQGSPSRLSSSIARPQLNAKLQDGSALSRTNQVYTSTFLHSSKSEGNQETTIKQGSGTPLSSFQLANDRPDLSKPLGGSAFSSGSTSNCTGQNPARVSPLTAERSRSHLISTVKPVSLTSNNSRSGQQPESYQYLDQPSSIPKRLTSAIKTKEFPDSCDKETVLPKSVTRNGKQRPAISAGSSSLFSGYSNQSETSTSASQLGEVVSFPSMPSLSCPAELLETPSPFAPSSSSAITPSRLSTSSGVKVSLSLSSASSPILPSTTPLAAEQLVSSSTTPVNILLKSPKTETEMDDNSTSQASMPKVISNLDGNVLPLKSMFPTGNSTSRFEPSITSVPTNELSASSLTGTRHSFSMPATPVMNFSLNTKSEQQQQAILPSTISSSGTGAGGKNNSDNAFTQEDEMEEEVLETSQLSLGSLSGFGIGSAPDLAVPKPHPFGVPFVDQAANSISPFPMSAPTEGLFRPASFSILSPQLSQPAQQTNFSGFSSGASNQNSTGKVFGQPAQIGSGQQALGSVLGAFGQSRQLGTGLPGNLASASAFGSGFGGSQSLGGFSNTGTMGGFVAAPLTGGGFACMASAGGGFGGAAATAGAGFAAAASGAGGSASGFPAAGGFGAFSKQGGGGSFSAFGSSGGTSRPPSELFTQMRK